MILPSRPRRRWAAATLVAAAAVAAGTALSGPAATAAGSPLTYSSQLGYNGHGKELFAYGMAYDPANNSILVGDLWNYRVVDYSTNGTQIRTFLHFAARGASGGFGAPFGLISDPAGDIWIADQSNSRVVELNSSGAWVRTIGYGGNPNLGPGCGGGHMTIPTHLVIANNELYVSDPRCGNVYIFSLTGSYVGQFSWPSGVHPIPRGITADPAGNIYVGEFNSRLIYKFTAGGAFVSKSALAPKNAMADVRGIVYNPVTKTIFAVGAEYNDVVQFGLTGNVISVWGGTTARPFDAIRFVTADPAGNLYVSDTFGYRVWKLDTAGNVVPSTSWVPHLPPPGSLNQNNGIVVTPDNKLYVVDSFANVVNVYNAAGSCTASGCGSSYLTAFGARGPLGNGSCNFDYPHAIAYDPRNGYLYTDATNAILEWNPANDTCVARFSGHGQTPGLWSNGPQGIAVANIGGQTDVVGADVNTGRLQVFTDTGQFVYSVSGPGKALGQMTGPRQVAVAGQYAYVADTGNSRVDVWNLTTRQDVATFNGPVAGVRLNQPRGVAVDPSGHYLYIGDSLNKRVVRVQLTSPTTFANAVVASTGADTPQKHFTGPQYLAFGPDGRLFVSDNSDYVYAFKVTG